MAPMRRFFAFPAHFCFSLPRGRAKLAQNFTTTKIFHKRFKLRRNFSKIPAVARVLGQNAHLFHVQKFGFTVVFNNCCFFRPDRPTDQPIGMIDPPRALSVQALHFGPNKSSLDHNPAQWAGMGVFGVALGILFS